MKRFTYMFIFSFILLMLAACGSEGSDTSSEETNANSGQNGDAASQETVVVEHELDTTEVAKHPEKIVVFDFGILDTLDELGVEVVGIPQSGTIPAYLDKYGTDDYENVGSLKEPDFEKLAEINPDLIIISGRQASLYDQLTELAPTIYLAVDTTNYMESFKNNMNVIGEIFGKEAEIEEELAAIDEMIAELNERASANEEKALIILANDDKISAYGPNSRFGIIHDVFGIEAVDEGIEASTHGMNVTFEYVMEQNPDILYVIDRGAVVGGEAAGTAKQLVENELVENTNAYKNDKIYYLNPEYWYLSGGGLVSVAEMVKEIDASID